MMFWLIDDSLALHMSGEAACFSAWGLYEEVNEHWHTDVKAVNLL